MIKANNKKIFSCLGDHRICMSSFVLATLTGAKLDKNFETVNTSSPSFKKKRNSLELNLKYKDKSFQIA